jgi:hypothetical protein
MQVAVAVAFVIPELRVLAAEVAEVLVLVG